MYVAYYKAIIKHAITKFQIIYCEIYNYNFTHKSKKSGT